MLKTVIIIFFKYYTMIYIFLSLNKFYEIRIMLILPIQSYINRYYINTLLYVCLYVK